MSTRLITPRFLALCAASSLYFLGLNMTLPVLPLFVEEELGGIDFQVGLAVSSFGIAAAVIRPFIGPLGDRLGRRTLVLVGCVVAGTATATTALAASIPAVIAIRAVTGIGEAAVFVGIASSIQDLTGDDRRAEAASYFSLTIYGSLLVGPLLGGWLRDTHGTDWVWLIAGALAVSAAFVGTTAPGPPAIRPPFPALRRLIHPAAIRPGVMLFAGLLGYTGFLAFAVVHGERMGMESPERLFVVFGAVVITLRIGAARLPDRLGPLPTTRISLSFGVVGLLLLFVWQEPAGAYLAAAVLAVAQTFLFPALFALVVDRAPDEERSQAIGSFSMFFDLAFGLGAPLIGVISGVSNLGVGFLVCAGIAAIALASARHLLGEALIATTMDDIGPRSRR
ncbi:MAG: MFS transporter [Acidimicrobiales bacterium]|nr:MFS transporter [Acidimicrobiales bacterium]